MPERKDPKGEGDYAAARRYRKDVEEFAKSGDVEGAAREAEKAVEGKEGDALREAEKAGKERARGEDPKLRR
ncbi:MAG: hypothetical protein ACFCVH_15700 [Alphaproteobacteria bacterium]